MPRRHPTNKQDCPRELQRSKPKSVAGSPKFQTLKLGIVVTLATKRRRSCAQPLLPLTKAALPRPQRQKLCSRISTSIKMSRIGSPMFLGLIRLNVKTTVHSSFISPCKSLSQRRRPMLTLRLGVQRTSGERARELSSVCRERFPQKVYCKLRNSSTL